MISLLSSMGILKLIVPFIILNFALYAFRSIMSDTVGSSSVVSNSTFVASSVSISSAPDPDIEPEPVKKEYSLYCDYCGRKKPLFGDTCRGCGAPVK